MTLLEGTAEGDVETPIERCWEVVSAIDEAPGWQQGVESVTVLQRDSDGRPSLCELVFDATFKTLTIRIEVSYEPPHRMSFALAPGSGSVQRLEGSWELTALSAQRTHARYALALDPGKLGLMARPLERALRPVIVGRRPAELAAEVARRAG